MDFSFGSAFETAFQHAFFMQPTKFRLNNHDFDELTNTVHRALHLLAYYSRNLQSNKDLDSKRLPSDRTPVHSIVHVRKA